jgi:hypothetical protein
MVDIPVEFLTGYVPNTNKLRTLSPQPSFHFLRIIEFRGVAIKVCVAQKIQKKNELLERREPSGSSPADN